MRLRVRVLISKNWNFILFIIYELCQEFNVLFRQDIPSKFVQMRLTHIKMDIEARPVFIKKLRMNHHTKHFSKLFLRFFAEIYGVFTKNRYLIAHNFLQAAQPVERGIKRLVFFGEMKPYNVIDVLVKE